MTHDYYRDTTWQRISGSRAYGVAEKVVGGALGAVGYLGAAVTIVAVLPVMTLGAWLVLPSVRWR